MSYCFIVASSDDRTNLLERMVLSFKKNPEYCTADVYLFYQGERFNDFKYKDFFKQTIVDKNLRGIFTPRYELMKRFSLMYDFTILIDDDLFLYPDTSYSTCMSFLEFNPKAGCCCIRTHRGKRKNHIENISASMGSYNVNGGLVFPRKSIEIILEYFKDKESDYTEDMFWLLLYVKGYDLFQDYSSSSIHLFNQKTKEGEYTGFSKMRTEKPHKPILSEWFDSKKQFEERYGTEVWSIKELKDINENGIKERRKNLHG